MTSPRPLFLLGPTASGKHEASILVAERLGAEIISVDSMKVYRGMDIGTAKPSAEDLGRVRHHLIDICDPSESYNAGRFVADASAARAEIEGRGRRPFFVGGTGLYYKAYVYGIFEGPAADPGLRRELEAAGGPALHAELATADPAAAARLHPNDVKRLVRAVEVWRLTGRRISELQTHFGRPSMETTTVCLRRGRPDLEARIAARVRRMIAGGLVDEVKRRLSHPWGREGRNAIGYREIVEAVEGRSTPAEAEAAIVRNTLRFVKRQLQWFRGFEGAVMLDAAPEEPASSLADRIVALAASG